MPTFPTLSVAPNYPLSPDGDLEDASLRSSSEAGYTQTRPRFTRNRRSFGLEYELNPTDESALRTFEATTLRNGADVFEWQHPIRGTTHSVQLSGPIQWSHVSFELTKARFTLKEV